MANGQDKILAVVCVSLLVLSIGYFYLTTSPEEEDKKDLILSATRDYTYPTDNINRYINATSLHTLLYDDNTSNDPYILSIRNAENFTYGHIPGAVNIPLSTLFSEENLEKLPTDQQIVVYCYTGHTASQATALLNVNGYDALCLKWGMCSWTNDSTVAANKYFMGGSDYPTDPPVTVEPVATGSSFAPQASIQSIPVKNKPLKPLACGGDSVPVSEPETDTSEESSESDAETLRKATYNSLNAGKKAVIKAPDLYANLNDGDSSNDPFVLSVRKAEHYALGHIPGAVNIGLGSLFTEGNLAKLPEDKNKQIVVVCYTGHTASQATALLNLNGYNATALMWGMCSWTTDVNVTVGKCFNKTEDSNDYSYSTGAHDEELLSTFYDALHPTWQKPIAVTASSLYTKLYDDDITNDPFILSIRSESDYTKGHIPGSVRIASVYDLFTGNNLAELDKLAKLSEDSDRQIVVVCYTGHTASQATALLNIFGYNATALKWGMCGWCANTTIAPKGFTRTADSTNYPICIGNEPGTIDEAEIAIPNI